MLISFRLAPIIPILALRSQPIRQFSDLLEIARRFPPDDMATPDDLGAIREARAEYASGRTIPHEAINWD